MHVRMVEVLDHSAFGHKLLVLKLAVLFDERVPRVLIEPERTIVAIRSRKWRSILS